MASDLESRMDPNTRGRLLGRLDAMVKSGRITESEATQLRTATEQGEFESAILEIRARHVGTRLDSAVDGCDLTRQDADAVLERVRTGEHSPALRAHLRKLLPGSRSRVRTPNSAEPNAG